MKLNTPIAWTIMLVVSLCTSWAAADDAEVEALNKEIAEIKKLVGELNTRVQQLEERITNIDPAGATAQSLDPLWKRFGIRLSEVKPEELGPTKSQYRGGMKVTAIREEGPSAKQGIRVGDILVGIHVWETVTDENVKFILNHEALMENKAVKFFIIRKGETLFAHVESQLE